jgi:PAS domain S-box-containing protein
LERRSINPKVTLGLLAAVLLLVAILICLARLTDHLATGWLVVLSLLLGLMSVLVVLTFRGLQERIRPREEIVREQVQRELQYEERYRDLIENANDIVFTTDTEGRIVNFNKAGEQITGFSRDEIKGWTLYDLADLNEKTINRCLHSPEAMTIEMAIRSRKGERVHLEVSTRPLNLDGQLAGVEGIARDITLRKRAEEELRRAYTLQRLQIENSPLAVIEWDRDFRITRWSARTEQLFGWRAEEVLGRSARELKLFHEEDFARFHNIIHHAAKQHGGNPTARGRCLSKSQQVVHCEWYNSSLYGDDGQLISILSLIHDETESVRAEQERLRLEEQVRHAHKMEAIGRLAGGIAHDFNNLLTVINGNSSLVRLEVETHSPVGEMVEEICKAGEQAVSLTRQLLAFSRKQILAPATIDLNAIIADMQKLLLRLMPENIEVEMLLDPFLMSIKADPGLMTQMILNLAVNARDAMPDGGRLSFRTMNGKNGWIRFEVEDNGCGMDEATRQRIFEPFFTTKGPGAGTGLGLSTVDNIVQQSNGRIEIESSIGEGTLFRIYLPCSASTPVLRASETSERILPVRSGETILLVEDEECVRTLARRVLEMQGYQVLVADSGPCGIDLFESQRDRIQLVLTDVMMPEMGGRELAEELTRRRPGLRIVFMSGYTSDEVLRQGIETEQVDFVQKPFTPEVLTRKIQTVLARKTITPPSNQVGNSHPTPFETAMPRT